MAVYRNNFPSSTNVLWTSYNTQTNILQVYFRSGRLYYYYGGSKRLYDSFVSAFSAGKFVWNVLYPEYAYRWVG